jgi:hypothetical protein
MQQYGTIKDSPVYGAAWPLAIAHQERSLKKRTKPADINRFRTYYGPVRAETTPEIGPRWPFPSTALTR